MKVIGTIDRETRCKHYHGPLDVIAIKFRCCQAYYSCYECHLEAAGHQAVVWPKSEWGEKAILCGACGTELSIETYMECGYICPACRIGFNPRCRNHYHLYFA
jgi:uncharacterized CHY-type Zn-finger protein